MLEINEDISLNKHTGIFIKSNEKMKEGITLDDRGIEAR